MEKIVEYKTLYMARGALDLEVNKMIGQGWQPYGSQYQYDAKDDALARNGSLIAQTMIKLQN